MIPAEYFIQLTVLIAPVFSSVTVLLIVFTGFVKSNGHHRIIQKYLLLYLLSALVSWCGMFFYFTAPYIFAIANSIFLLSFILIQVFFYGFVFSITQTQNPEHLSKLHYIAPGVLFILLTILMIITPLTAQIMLVENFGAEKVRPLLFYYLSNNKMAIRLVFTIIYTILCFYRLYKYRLYVVNYSSNYDKSQLRWVNIILVLSILLIIIPFTGVIIDKKAYVSSWLSLVPVILLMFQYSYLTYQVIGQNYLVIMPIAGDIIFETTTDVLQSIDKTVDTYDKSALFIDNETETTDIADTKKQFLTPEKFELYIESRKPYLNPDLKITDLVEHLGINRTYISSFINSYYNVNFSRYINLCRINEFNRLQKLECYKDKTKHELCEMAGFNSYKNFVRFKNSL